MRCVLVASLLASACHADPARTPIEPLPPPVIADLTSATSLPRTTEDAMVLGFLGNRTAYDALRAVMLDQTRPARLRAVAATALGKLAERSELPWSARITTASNYRAKTAVLAKLMEQP